MAVVTLAGVGMSYYGQQQQAKAVEQTADYNAKILRTKAKSDGELATQNMRRLAADNGRFVASVRAEQAKGGFSLAGTPLEFLGDVRTELEQQLADSSFASAQHQQELREKEKMVNFEGKATASAMRTQAVGDLATGLFGAGTSTGSAAGMF